MSQIIKMRIILFFLMGAFILQNMDMITSEASVYTGYGAVYQNNLQIYTNQRSDERMMQYLLMEPDHVYAYKINDEIRQVCREITVDCNTDMEKLHAIHDWVCNNIYQENVNGSGEGSRVDPVYVFEHRGTQCEGYVNLTASMCREVGIPCKVMEGYGYNGLSEEIENLKIEEILEMVKTRRHVWNEAWVDGRWVLLDTTLDSHNYKLTNSEGEEVTYAPCSQDYFDISLEEYSKKFIFAQYISFFESKFDDWNKETSTETAGLASSTEKIENLLTVSGSSLTSNDKSHDKTENGSYQYDGYIQTMKADTIKAEYPYYKVTFRTNETLPADTEIFNFQPFNMEWGGWDSNVITMGDATYDEKTGEYTAYIAIQDICKSLSSGTLQGINLSFCNKEPVVTLTGFYHSSAKGASVQAQETENAVTASQPAITDKKGTTTDKDTTDKDTYKEKKPSKPGRVKWTSCKSKRKGQVKMKWKKVSGSDGYQVQWSRSRSFSRKKTIYAYGKTKTLDYGLKSKKKYFIRVRAYKEGNSANNYQYVYGNWSKVKKVKVK